MLLNSNSMNSPINASERRQSERLKVNLAVSFEQFHGLKTKGESLTRDISTSGLRMNVDGYFTPHTQLSFKLDLPEIKKRLSGIVQIIWSQRISYSDRYQIGLQFFDMLPEEKRSIEDYIREFKSKNSDSKQLS